MKCNIKIVGIVFPKGISVMKTAIKSKEMKGSVLWLVIWLWFEVEVEIP